MGTVLVSIGPFPSPELSGSGSMGWRNASQPVSTPTVKTSVDDYVLEFNRMTAGTQGCELGLTKASHSRAAISRVHLIRCRIGHQPGHGCIVSMKNRESLLREEAHCRFEGVTRGIREVGCNHDVAIWLSGPVLDHEKRNTGAAKQPVYRRPQAGGAEQLVPGDTGADE